MMGRMKSLPLLLMIALCHVPVAMAETYLIELGESIDAAIESPGEYDAFVFDIDEPMLVTLFTEGDTDTLGTLYKDSLIAFDDDSGAALNFSMNEELDPGRYFLFVDGATATVTGQYRLVTTAERSGNVARQYLMTTSSSRNVSSLHVLNTHDEPQAFVGTLYNGDGTQLGEARTQLHDANIAANGRLILSAADLETLFGIEPWRGPAMLEVFGPGSFELMSKLESPSGLVSNTNCVREGVVLNVEGSDSENQTYIRLVNTSSSATGEILGTLYDTNGLVIGNPAVTLSVGLAAKQAIWINADQLAELIDGSWTGEALLKVDGPEGLKLLNLNLVNNETFLNFSCFQNSDSNFIYLQTTSNSLNRSETHIVNVSEESDQYLGTLYNQAGEQLGAADVPLHELFVNPNGRLILTSENLESIFDVDSWRGPAMLKVTGSSDFELMTRLASPSGLISNSNCVAPDAVHNIEGDDENGRTFVRFINQGSEEITDITGSLYDSNGQLIGSAGTALIDRLGPFEARWLNRADLANAFGSTWTGEASLRVSGTNDQQLRMINLNFVNGETFFNFSCFESNNLPPAVQTSNFDQAFNAGDAVNLPVASRFNDAESSITLEARGLPEGLSLEDGIITGTLTDASVGNYTVTVVATDAALSTATTTFQLVVVGDSWTSGVFSSAENFEAQCANPRIGTDPFTDQPYPDNAGSFVDENNWLRSWTNDLYLWYDEVIDRDPADYSTPQYFDLLKTNELTPAGNPKDNFHFSANTQEYRQDTELGESVGYGMNVVLLRSSPPRELVLAYVEPDSPAAAAGLTRGARLVTIDGVDVRNGSDVDTLNAGLFPRTQGESHEFVVQDLDTATTRTVNLTADVVSEVRVRDVNIIPTSSGDVGYLVFNSHFDSAEPLLIDAFSQFRNAGISDLVLDLRYNGGGLVGIAAEVAYMIAGETQAQGETFIEYRYNDKYREVDPFSGRTLGPIAFPTTTIGYATTPGQPLPTVDLERVFILATSGTCSASELIINSLRGIDVEVILIGDTTCGKPYGFVPQDNCGTTYFTIQFTGVNAKGFGEYPAGFSPSFSPEFDTELPGCRVGDDFNHVFGDTDEEMLSTALYYRENGICPDSGNFRPHPSAFRRGELLRPEWRSILFRDQRFDALTRPISKEIQD